jgi:hypothetical protein
MRRAEELLRKMTIEEKAMQLSSVFPFALFDTNGTNHSQLDAPQKHGIGHVSALGLIGHKTPETLAKSVNAIQRFLVTKTRLKIAAIFHNEAMSGVVAPHFTAFHTSIGLDATWDPAAVEEMADIIRRQMRSVGLLQALAPVMDVARDARWGRVSETYGEDPYLVSAGDEHERGDGKRTEDRHVTTGCLLGWSATTTTLPLDSVCRVWREGMTPPIFRRLAYGNLAGDMNGFVASSTNMTSWSRLLVPLLKTSIGMSAPCPFMVWPASAWLTPCGVFWATRPVST